ncbi:hypothetical protein [Methylobacterium nigriterrae]|uniref:hypothetical protein n=1 Tax=Methylobacterium nigriterrae TaxID=3127512 RepID=UPI0030138CD9
MLGEIVNEHAPARLDDDTADIKIGAYLDAVDDLPAWAIREAMRRWRRGEVSGDARDLDFAPKPPRLRRLAQSIAATASGQAIRLQRILDAQPEDEMPEEARAENQKRLVAVLKDIGEPAIEPAGSAAAERAQARRELNERILAVEAERKARIAERDAAESEAIDV